MFLKHSVKIYLNIHPHIQSQRVTSTKLYARTTTSPCCMTFCLAICRIDLRSIAIYTVCGKACRVFNLLNDEGLRFLRVICVPTFHDCRAIHLKTCIIDTRRMCYMCR